MPRTSGILETSLYVDDLQGSVAFYRDLFDFELFFAEHRMAALGVPGGQVLLLFQRGATLEPAPGPGGGSISRGCRRTSRRIHSSDWVYGQIFLRTVYTLLFLFFIMSMTIDV